MKKIVYTGSFGTYLLANLGLVLLDIVTLGFGAIYHAYWNQKYFVEHLEIKE